jgi:hypothetical protein
MPCVRLLEKIKALVTKIHFFKVMWSYPRLAWRFVVGILEGKVFEEGVLEEQITSQPSPRIFV